MKLLLIVCVLALAVTPGQAQNPESFRVLDKINGILDRELNVLDGGSSQVALRGNMNFMKVGAGGKWTTFKGGAEAKYEELKKDVKDGFGTAEDKFKGGMVWAKSAMDKHPYRWMAFKVGVTIVTTILCPLCSFGVGLAFLAIDSVAQLKNLKDASDDLPEGLTDEAKAACLSMATLKTLMVIAGGAVNIFVPIPVDAGGAATAAAAEIFGQVDFSPLLEGTIESAKGGLAVMGAFIKDVIKGAVGEKANEVQDKVLGRLKDKGAKIAKVSCSKMADRANEVSTGDDDEDTPKLENGD